MTKHAPQHRFRERPTVTQSPRRWVATLSSQLGMPVQSVQRVLRGAPITGGAFGVGCYFLHASIQLVIVGAIVVSVGTATVRLVIEAVRTRVDRPLAGLSVRSLTGLAALLAGRKRPALRAEWRAHLAGETGHDPVTWQKVREALGFVASAIRCRCSDAAEATWTPVDAVLKSRTRSNLFVLVPTWAAAYLLLRHEGTLGVVKAAESISAIGGTLYGLIRVGRWWRNVKPPEPKARRAKE